MNQSRPTGPAALRESISLWVICLGGIALFKFVLARVIPPAGALTGAVAVAAFLYGPEFYFRRRGEVHADYGLSLARWPRDLAHALIVMAIIFPLFAVAFSAFAWSLPRLPPTLAALLAPYGTPHAFSLRLPEKFLELCAGNAAVAVAEEFFYRGYMQTLLERGWPPGARAVRFLGVPMGRAFFVTAALFAVGHLLEPAPWRLGVFFPALLFGWIRGRTGTVAGAALVHGTSNVFLAFLEASFYG